MPSIGKPIPAIQPNKDGSVTIQYVPIESGVHELNLSFNEAPVDGKLLDILHRVQMKLVFFVHAN